MRTNSNILKILGGVFGKDLHTTLHDFFIMSAISVRNQVDLRNRDSYEKRYMDIASTYKPNDLKLFSRAFAEIYREYQAMLDGNREWTDLAGEIYMESATSNDKSGQFFTPYCISRACAEADITEEDVKEKLTNDPDDVIKILEPSCGAGGMIIAAAEVLQNHKVNYAWNMCADCTDVDERCVCMAYLQLSLLGIPAIIHHGNSLTLEEWSRWYTPAYIFNSMHFKHRIESSWKYEPKAVLTDNSTPQKTNQEEKTRASKTDEIQLSLF